MVRPNYLVRCGEYLLATLMVISLAACGSAATPAPQAYDIPISPAESATSLESLVTPIANAGVTSIPSEPTATAVPNQVVEPTMSADIASTPHVNSNGSESLSGAWERITPENEDELSFLTVAEQIEFLNDGTFVLPKFMNQSGSYSFPENGRIKFEGAFGAAVYKFTVSGDTLIFDENDRILEYRRMK